MSKYKTLVVERLYGTELDIMEDSFHEKLS